MKRIGKIRKQFLTRERLLLIVEALTNAERQRGWTPAQRKRWHEFLEYEEENVERIWQELRYQVFQPDGFIIFHKKEGQKTRTIYESCPRELIVDTLLLDCLNYVFLEQKHIVHRNCYGSIKGRGQHELRKRIIDLVHRRDNLYAYVGDTAKYYPTMDHEVLMQTFRQHIKDQWLLWLCDVCVSRLEGARGIALGLPSSNPIGHIYHAIIDWYIILTLKVRRYYRFCDDKYMFHRDVNYLHAAARSLRDKTESELHQTIKPSWRVVNCKEERFECLGAMVNSHNARLKSFNRRRIERNMRRCIKKGDPMEALLAWSGINGSLIGLGVSNLINYWHEVYSEFFNLLAWARQILAEARRRKKWHAKLEKILTKAKDERSESNKQLYPYGFVISATRKAA